MKIINLMENTKGSQDCACEHGLSFYIETKNHKLDEIIPKLCRNHKQNYTMYCTKCKVNLCIECLKTHEHKNEIIETAKSFKADNIQKYNEFLRSMREHSSNFVSLYKKIMTMIDNYKAQITAAYEKTCKINQNINTMYKTFIEHAARNKNNYYILENLEHFGAFSFKRFKFQDTKFNLQNFNGKDLMDYKSYVTEGAMLVEKASSNFEGLQRTKEWTFEHFISSLSFYNPPQAKECYFVIGFNNGNLGIMKESLNAKKDKVFIAKESHKGRILFIHVNGNFIYTSGFDQLIKKWEIVPKHQTYEIEYRKTFRGHRDEVRQVFTISGQNTIISCSGDDNVIIWEDEPNSLIISPKKTINVDSSITSMLLCKDNKHIVVATCDNEIMVYNLEKYQQTCCLEDIYCCSTGCLSYVNDFIVVYGNKILTIFSLKDGKLNIENSKKFDSSDDIRNGISDVMFSIIPVGTEEVILSNLKKSILKINLKNDKIQVKEFSDKENIEGLYHILSKKYAIVFGKRVEILSN